MAVSKAWKAWKIRQGLLVAGLLSDSDSSGGGGPGGNPISTVTGPLHRAWPPSLEKTGEILSNPGITGEVPSSPRRSTSKKSRKRQCPKGYLRDPRTGKCVWWSEVSRKHQNAWSR